MNFLFTRAFWKMIFWYLVMPVVAGIIIAAAFILLLAWIAGLA